MKILSSGILIASLLIQACSLPTEEARSLEEKDREYLRKSFTSVEGDYAGVLTGFDRQSTRIGITLYTLEMADGVNNNGEQRFRPVLKARYRNFDFINETSDTILDASYFPESGDLVLSDSQTLSITGRLIGGVITGSLSRQDGKVGSLEATRTGSTAGVPTLDPVADYDRLVGTYQGTLSSVSGVSIPIEIGIYSLEASSGFDESGKMRLTKVLKARYRNSRELDETGDVIMDVAYSRDSRRLVLTTLSSLPNGVTEVFSISGIWKDDLISGNLTRQDGVVGEIKATKVNNEYRAPVEGIANERRMRLIELYTSLSGIYRGLWTRPNNEKIPVEFEVFISYRKFTQTPDLQPILQARMTRLDLKNIVAMYMFDEVSYYPSKLEIVGRSNPLYPPNPIGGGTPIIDGMSFTGSLNDGRLAVRLTNATGFVGTLSLDRNR